MLYWKLSLPVDLWLLLKFLSAGSLIIWLLLRYLKGAWPARCQWLHLKLDFLRHDKLNTFKKGQELLKDITPQWWKIIYSYILKSGASNIQHFRWGKMLVWSKCYHSLIMNYFIRTSGYMTWIHAACIQHFPCHINNENVIEPATQSRIGNEWMLFIRLQNKIKWL